MNANRTPEWANDIPVLDPDVRRLSERAVNQQWAEQLQREAEERARWLKVLSPSPQPHHNTQVRDLESFTKRQRLRMKLAGWIKGARHA